MENDELIFVKDEDLSIKTVLIDYRFREKYPGYNLIINSISTGALYIAYEKRDGTDIPMEDLRSMQNYLMEIVKEYNLV